MTFSRTSHGEGEVLQARILIVDDQASDVAMLEMMLHGAGFVSVASTSDPRAVCELHRDQRFDLILLDLQMPGMDGFQVMEGLKEIEPGGDLPVLVLAAHSAHRLRALNAGAKDFVSKPLEVAEVLMRVWNLLEVRLLHRTEMAHNLARLENAQRIAGLADWEHDFVKQRLVWSEGVYRLLGLARREVEPDPEVFYRMVHPEDLERVRRERMNAAAGSGRAEFEHRIIRADGEVRHLHQIVELVRDGQGWPERESGTLQDITERIAGGEALRRSEERYRLLFEHNPSPMMIFDQETGGFLSVNAAAFAFYGYSRTEFLRMTAAQLSLPDDAAHFPGQDGSTHPYAHSGIRTRHVKKDGVPVPVEIFVHGVDFGGRAARLVLAVDRTESERAAAALQASEARFRALSESAPIGIFECDAEGRLSYGNPALTTLSGRPQADILGVGWKDCIAAEDRPGATAGWAAFVAEDGRWDRQLRVRRPDGAVRWVHVLAVRSRGGADATLGFIGTVQDITERQAAEESLRLLGSAVEQAKESILITDAELELPGPRIVFCNPAFTHMTGFTAQEVLGKTPRILQGPRTDRALLDRLKQTLARGDVFDGEAINCRRDGTEFDLAWQVTPIRNAAGAITHFVAIQRDITARKRAEEELRGKTALLEAQIDSSIDGILMNDPHGKRILRNQRYVELMGMPPEIAASADEAAACRFVTERMRDPEAVRARVEFLTAHPYETSWEEIELKDGTVLDRYSSPILGKEGRLYGRIWAFRDITANRAAVRGLRESEERFKLVARAVSDVVWDWDISADTLWWGGGFLAQFGFAAGEVAPSVQAWDSRIHPDEQRRVAEGRRFAIDNQAESWSAEYRLRRKDGSYAFVEDGAYILRDASGQALRMVGGMRDFTERKRLDEHFLQAQKMEALGQFSGGVAHDFNNILAVIGGYAELSRMILKENPEVREHLAAVLVAVGRATDLVRQILTFSRQQPQVRQAIPLQPVVEESIKLMRATLPSTIAFDLSIARDAPTVLANANQIHQVLMNLGTNAAHAMKDRTGRLQVILENFPVDEAFAATRPRLRVGTYARVSVGDTGCGMDAATLRRIFEPFFTTKPPGEGTGLGLAAVHGIMDGHDGAVTVSSQPGEGTMFRLYFPAHAGEADLPAVAAAPVPRGRGERILVVDDEELLARLGQKTLNALGYDAEFVTDPAAALALVVGNPDRFALVLADQTMPGMTGLLLATHLRKIRPGLPVVLLTGYSATLTADRLAAAGVRELLLKPVSVTELGVAVRAALPDADVL